MMFLDLNRGGDVLAISQPAHAWVSGQLLRHWATDLDEGLLFAAEQHDLAWIDWERAPSFDPRTGRPHLFRDVGAAAHAPRWLEAVERAYASWGTRVALFISRHGTVIYTRFTDRHRVSGADASAAAAYVEQQAPIQAAWARQLGLGDETLERETDLIALVDGLSLGLCGALPLPLELGGYRLARTASFAFTLEPWPFRGDRVVIATEARLLPGGRFASEAEMRAWSAAASSAPLHFTLTRAATSA
jgi:hypothetical protein